MMIKDGVDLIEVIISFSTFCRGVSYKDINDPGAYWWFNSMEQLWLVYVMKEKYNKLLGGKDWVLKKTLDKS